MINLPSDLRPGDQMFGPIGGKAGDLIVGPGQLLLASWKHRLSWRTWWRIRHAATVVTAGDAVMGERPTIGQAMPNGFEIVDLRDDQWSEDYVFIRPRWRDPLQGDRAADVARRMRDKRVGYSYATYVRLAAHRTPIPTPHLDKYVNRVDAEGYPVQAICSQANDFVLTKSGGLTADGKVFDDGRAHADVVPSELYLRLLELRPVAVCRPGRVLTMHAGAGLLSAGSIPRELL
jgi:hypothetical protein